MPSILAAAVLLILAAWLLVPRWLAGPGMRMASEAIGREVTVADVRFQPWRLALSLDGLRVAGAQPQDPPLLTIARVDTALSLRSIWHASPVVASLQIEQPVLRLARVADGHYDIDDLLARFAQPSPKPDAKPARLGLYNIQLRHGQVLLEDRPVERRHEISDLQLDLPFLSTLDAHIQLAVQPHLSGKLNGVVFGSEAQLLPFGEKQEARLDFKLARLDLAPYLPYLPEELPLRVQRGQVEARLSVNFSQAPKQAPVLQLSGELVLADFALRTPAGQPWLGWRELRIGLKDVQPLRQQVHLASISWSGPELSLRRDSAGLLWLPGHEAPATAAKPSAPWALAFESFELKDAALDWQDASQPLPVTLRATDVQARLGRAAWPLQPGGVVPVSYALRLASVNGQTTPASLKGEGRLAADQLQISVQWQDLNLSDLAPYLRAQLPATLAGSFSGRAELNVARPLEADAASRASLNLQDLRIAKPALGSLDPAQPVLSAALLQLDELKLDLATKLVQAGELGLQQPVMQLARAADGRWRHDSLMPAGPGSAASAPPQAQAWQITARGVKLDQGTVQLQDAKGGDSLVQAQQIQLNLRNLAWPASADPVRVQLSLALGRDHGKTPGGSQVAWQGQVVLAPLGANGKLQVERLPLQLLDPYLDPAWGIQLRRAELGLKGEFALAQRPEGWQASWHGDAGLGRLRVNQASWQDGQRVIGQELLGWKSLDLSGVALQSKPGSPPEVVVAKALLDDYYMRLNVDEKGRFNISDLGPKADAAKAPAPPAAAASAPVVLLSVGQTQFSKGEVDFSDHFIRPNYSARLSALEGSLGGFTTGKPAMAALSLRGKVQGTGDLTVEGQLNPLGAPLTMEIKARASDIELSPFSPYAAKYAGYAIERGKLSTQVEYKLDASGQLQASNKITLNQLTFGDRVESPDATTLPVLLAVALLKDSDGVIDVELPVSGSINDPDFSIGGLVFKLIGNLLAKALTAPFSLFSGGSHDEDVSQAGFAPGSAVPSAPDQLDAVVKMLTQRPTLELTITGWADAGADAQALQQRLADAAAEAERRREQRRQQRGAPAAAGKAAMPAGLAVGDDQLQQLASERGAAIRDALLAKGIANSRLFLATARVTESAAADWKPHADLSLSVR